MAPLLTPGWACAVHRAICLPRADFPVMLREAQTQEGRGFGGDPSTGAGPRPQDPSTGAGLITDIPEQRGYHPNEQLWRDPAFNQEKTSLNHGLYPEWEQKGRQIARSLK